MTNHGFKACQIFVQLMNMSWNLFKIVSLVEFHNFRVYGFLKKLNLKINHLFNLFWIIQPILKFSYLLK